MDKKLLAIMAHPDDESFGPGGSLARYARQGAEVYLLCATGGENGTVDPKFLGGFASIADLRASELSCAAQKLGLAGVSMAGYRDSGMAGSPENRHPEALAAQPVEAVAMRIAAEIRRIRPQVVITHDPIGNYRHPDHIAVHNAVVRAFELAADPNVLLDSSQPPFTPARLYFHTFPKTFLKAFIRVLTWIGQDTRRFGRNHDIDLLALVEGVDFPIHAWINIRRFLGVREAASACHASQLASGPPLEGFLGRIFRFLGRWDYYMRAYPEPEPGLRVIDLFAGL